MLARNALHDGRQHASGLLLPRLERMALDLPHLLAGFGARLVDDLADQRLACLRYRQAADAFELDQLALLEVGKVLALCFELAAALLERRLAALDRLELAVERLSTIEQHPLLALEVGAFLACLLLGRALKPEGLVLSLEDELLLLGAGLCRDAGGVRLGVLGEHGGDDAPSDVADQRAQHQRDDRHDDDDEFRHRLPPQRWSPDGRYRRPLAGEADSRFVVSAIGARVPECTAHPVTRPAGRQAPTMRPMLPTMSRSRGRKSCSMIRCTPAAPSSSMRARASSGVPMIQRRRRCTSQAAASVSASAVNASWSPTRASRSASLSATRTPVMAE